MNLKPVVIPLVSSWNFDPSGRYLAAICQVYGMQPNQEGAFQWSSSDRILALWDLTALADPIATEDRSEWESLVFSLDGKRIALGGGNGVEIRELPSLKTLHQFRFALQSKEPLAGASWRSESSAGSGEYAFKIHSVRFSHDGRKIYAACADGRINLADLDSGHELAPWKGHKGAVLSLAIDATGQWLASGGEDRTVRLWDTATGRERARWEAHEESVTVLAFAHSSERLVSGSSDGYAKLWDLPRIRRELALLRLDW
jgi:WD40 repeat protein